MKLTARYDVHLSAYLMVSVPEEVSDQLSLNFRIDDYDLEIKIDLDKSAGYLTKIGKVTTYGSNHLIVRVSHSEDDLDQVKSDVIQITQSFEKIAETGINRLIRFFKFKLNNPLLREVSGHDDPWSNKPKWYDEEANEIDLRLTTSDYSRHLAFGYFPRYGMKALEDINDVDLHNALRNSIQPELYEEFLAAARTEIIEGNLRRAILEMAVGCEVFVKTTLFSASPISGAIFDYLASQRKIDVSIPELIHKPSKETFGSSFKIDNPDDFKKIGHLFQARNRVAHSGKSVYKDDKGNEIEVDEILLESWWQALATLVTWLKTKMPNS